MRRATLPVLSLAFAIGVAVARLVDASLPWAAGASALSVAVVVWALRSRAVRGVGVALVLTVFVLGFLRGRIAAERVVGDPPPQPGDAPRIGRVVDGPWPSDDGVWLDVELERAARPGTRDALVRIYTRSALPGVAVGDRVAFRATLRPRRATGNPGARGASGPGWSAGLPIGGVVRVRGGASREFFDGLTRSRDRLAKRLVGAGGRRSGGVIAALALGARRLVPWEVRERLAKTGTAHALALSGLHLGLVGLWLYAIIGWTLRRSEAIALRLPVERVVAALTLLGLVAFTLFVGAGVSTRRALFMAAALLSGRILGRATEAADALSLAAIALLAISPELIMDAGFLLSASAVTAILWAAPAGRLLLATALPAARVGPWLRRVGVHLLGALWVSLAAGLGTAPVLIAVFHRLAPLSVLANLVAVPLLALVVLPVALLTTLAAALLPATALTTAMAPAVWVVERWLDAIAWMSEFAPSLPSGGGLWAVVAMALGAGLVLRAPTLGRGRRLAASLGLAFLVAPWGAGGSAPVGLGARTLEAGSLEAIFLNVGHGAAIIVRSADGQTMLVDGGGRRDGRFGIGRARVLPALRALGVGRLDVMALTHGHADHVTGLVETARAMSVGELWLGVPPPRGPLALSLVAAVRASGGRVRRLRRGAHLRFGRVPVRVLGPAPQPANENDRSLILSLGPPDRALLLTGDVEAAGERASLAFDAAGLGAAVLQAPHHGSGTSSTRPFITTTAARVVVYSRGPGRFPALPAPRVTRRYRAAGAIAFDTEQDGAVTVRIGEDAVTVSAPGRWAPGRPARPRRLRLARP